MSEPWPDALFGVDGTELPSLSGRGRQPDAAMPPSFVLPHIPLGTTREEVAAAFGDEAQRPADQDPAAGSAAAGTAGAAGGSAPAAGSGAMTTAVPPSAAAQATTPLPVTPGPAPQLGSSPPAGAAAGYNPRPEIGVRVAPVQPLPRSGSGIRSRQQLMARSRSLEQLRNTRLRVARRLPTHTRSNGGAGAFFLVMSITIAVLLYFIISGIVEAFARLIP
ncbi:MAG TPA: hypothetical protein VJS67_09435 [Pseudonocardiaceae bacterium]|nr:hypothetical protein [Pseudonocardiaceae bacterium]